MKTNFSRVFFYIWPHIKKHRTAFSLTFIGYGIGAIAANLYRPYIYKNLVDLLVSSTERSLMYEKALWLGTLVFLSMVVQNITYRIGDYSIVNYQSKIMKELYDKAFSRILRHSYHFFSNNFSGSLVAKSKRFVKSFETFTDILSIQTWFTLVSMTGTIIILFFQAQVLGFILLGWSILYMTIVSFFIKFKLKYDLLEAEADSKVTGSLADAIQNVLNIKIFSGEKKEEENFALVTEDEERKRTRSWKFSNMQFAVQSVMMIVLQSILIYASIYLWNKGEISVGVIVLTQAYALKSLDLLWDLSRSLVKAIKALTDMKEVIDIFDADIDIKDPSIPEIPQKTKGLLEFKNISFKYKNGVSVFKNFDLTIKPEEHLGLVGHSGAGKSTITKLLLRFADVEKGEILIDGQNIKNILQKDLRSIVSYVPQDSSLFHRTIKENISYSKPNATDSEIEEVARKAHAHEFIMRLPDKYDTIVGERGVKLSGGERQRIAIARAMLKNSPILILDEATSSLDSESEHLIQNAFVELMKGKTTLVIAHRLSTIQKMDRILVLEDGKIVEEGTHQELVKSGGAYSKLWNRQSGGFV